MRGLAVYRDAKQHQAGLPNYQFVKRLGVEHGVGGVAAQQCRQRAGAAVHLFLDHALQHYLSPRPKPGVEHCFERVHVGHRT